MPAEGLAQAGERVRRRRFASLLSQRQNCRSAKLLRGQNALDDIDAMVEPRHVDDVEHRTAGAELGIARPEHDTAQAPEKDRAGAHRARFEGHEDVGAGQPPIAERGARGADREDFGVCARIVRRLGAVVAAPEDAPVEHDDGADRDLALFGGAHGFVERDPHPVSVIRYRTGSAPERPARNDRGWRHWIRLKGSDERLDDEATPESPVARRRGDTQIRALHRTALLVVPQRRAGIVRYRSASGSSRRGRATICRFTRIATSKPTLVRAVPFEVHRCLMPTSTAPTTTASRFQLVGDVLDEVAVDFFWSFIQCL
jgi:hypothetical protein